MNTKQAYKIIDAGWAKKRTGYRIQFQQQIEGKIVTDYFPDLDDGLWLSEVAIWRMAWRLAESRQSDPPDINAGDLINVTVIDHEGNPVKYYATNHFEVFNPIDTEI